MLLGITFNLFYHCLPFITITMESIFGFTLCTLFFKQLYIYFITVCLFLQCILNLNSNSVHVFWTSCYNCLSITDKDVTPTSALVCQTTRELIVVEVILSLQMSHDTPSSCVVEKGDSCMWRFVPAECWGYCYVAGLFDNRMLTHLPLDNMATISQLAHSTAFLWMRTYVFWNFTEVCS